ncbi:hypothetical protein MOTE_05660 [Moorella thermoacetica]|uniref:DUF5320 domain-containing protein n=1 Tax=Neomoorella thermoacetica TaxID=1525 RepID=A0A1J5NPA2_NEOTH|nr:hypothetical protein MOTE_05660 [Moorella thermoacetica]
MPRGDRTGPWGLGPRTGRGAGYCNGFPVPGFMNPTPGFGRGLGLGRGRGPGLGRRLAWGLFPPAYGWLPAGWWGAPFPGAVPPQGTAPDVEFLKQQAAMLESQLQAVKEQLKARQQDNRDQDAPGQEEDL